MHSSLLKEAYLLGLLAMIKCSICSYQCDNWYAFNRKLACHINFSWGVSPVSLLAAGSRVALAWHFARCGAPFGGHFLKLRESFALLANGAANYLVPVRTEAWTGKAPHRQDGEFARLTASER